jgi:hypothetical protein
LPTGLSLTGSNISGTPTVIADSSTLLTATAATTNRTAVRTINWSITVANDVYFEYNTLLIPGASTTFVDDASTNNFAVSIFGDTKPNSFNPYTPGYYSNYFDGSGDYLSVPHNTLLDLWVGNFTIEMWVYSTQNQSNYTGLITKGGSNVGWTGWQVVVVSNCVNVEVPPGSLFFSNATTLPNNQWVHIAIVKSSTNVSLFQNGTRISAVTGSSTTYSNTADNTLFGTDRQASLFLNGYISNTRTVKGTAVYDPTLTTLTVPTSPLTAIANTSLLTCQSNRFIDNSGNAFTITVIGNTSISSFDPFVPNTSYSTYGSGYFDGTGDYLTVPGNSVFAFGTGDFTLEVWLYANSISTGTFDRICATSDYNGSGFDWTLNTNSSGLFLAGTSYGIGSITTKRWHHLVYTRSGSVIRGFLNGNLSSYTTGASQNVSSVTQLNIGTGYSGTPLNGYMVDLRIIKGSIPAGYQTSSTTTGTQIFTPPSEPLTAVSGTSLLTLQNNQSVNNNVFLDNSTNNLLVTRNGNTSQGTFSPYGGNWSTYCFTGGNYLSFPGTNILPTGTENFTVELWFYRTNAWSAGGQLISTQGTNNGFELYVNTSAASIRLSGYAVVSVIEYAYATIALNTWNHFAVTRSGNNFTMWLNGVSVSTATNSVSFTAPSTSWIGSSSFDGYFSNVRVIRGTALYSTTFTPSTTPLTSVSGTSLLTCQNSRWIDNSPNGVAITPNLVPSVQRFNPFNPVIQTPTSYSVQFTSSTNNFSTPYNVALNIYQSVCTVECWVYLTSIPVTYSAVIYGTEPWDGGSTYTILCITTTGNIEYSTRNMTLGNRPTSTSTVPINQWTHIAWVRSGALGVTWEYYINGIAAGTGSWTGRGEESWATNLPVGVGNFNADRFFPGSISNLRVVKGVAVYTGAFTPPTSPLTATQSSGTNISAITGTSTSLLTCQSETAKDNSTNLFPITATGGLALRTANPFGFTNTTTSGYTPSTIGGSGYFDGTDYLSNGPYTGQSMFIPSYSTAQNVSATIEFWIYPTTTGAGRPYSYTTSSVGIGADIGMFCVTNGSGSSYSIQFGWYNQGTSYAVTGGAALPNAWTHVAFTYNPNGGVGTLYVNGVSVGTPVSGGNVNGGPPNSITNAYNYIGVYSPGSSPSYFTGYISDFRYTTNSILYTGNFVPPSAPLTAIQNATLLLNMTSAGVYDAAMMTNMETVADAQLSTTVTKFGGSSMFFDGTGDYLFSPTLNVNNLSKFLTSNFTVECWIYPTTTSGDRTVICAVNSWGAGANYEIELRAGVLFVQIGNSITLTSGTTSISTNTWTHIALVRSSTTSTTFYVNGVSVATTATNWTADEDCPLTIGCFNINGGSLSNYWQGYIDDLRITKGYARYTSNFTPPTTAFPVY